MSSLCLSSVNMLLCFRLPACAGVLYERVCACLLARVCVCVPACERVYLLVPLTFVHMQGSNVMEDQDLRDIGITDPGHRKKILHAARSLPKVVNITARARHREKTVTDSVSELKGQNIHHVDKKW